MRQEVNSVAVETPPCRREPQTAGWWWRTKRSLSYLERCPDTSLLWHLSVLEKVWQTEWHKMVGVFNKCVSLKRKSPERIWSVSISLWPGLLQHDGTVQERQKSSDILEELLNQGIIPVGPSRERGSVAGEAYSIMVGTVRETLQDGGMTTGDVLSRSVYSQHCTER